MLRPFRTTVKRAPRRLDGAFFFPGILSPKTYKSSLSFAHPPKSPLEKTYLLDASFLIWGRSFFFRVPMTNIDVVLCHTVSLSLLCGNIRGGGGVLYRVGPFSLELITVSHSTA